MTRIENFALRQRSAVLSTGVLLIQFFCHSALACSSLDEAISIANQIKDVASSYEGEQCSQSNIDKMKLIHRLTIQYEHNVNLAKTNCPESIVGDPETAKAYGQKMRTDTDELLEQCGVPTGSY